VEGALPDAVPTRLRAPPAGLRCLRSALAHARFSIAYAGPDNFMGQPIDGYGAPGAWLREPAAQALLRAEAAFAEIGLFMVIFDAYRPLRATEHMWRWAGEHGRRDLFEDGWIARPSRHNSGVAVDLSLSRIETGAALDMGSPFDAFVPESHVRGVTGDALANRLVLRRVMLAAGFRPLEAEWWHFDLPLDAAPRLDVPYGVHEHDAA
jgi:D-alanyl-D-alanine dipeptidase